MTIRLTDAEVEEQYQEADEEELQFDPSDQLDITLKYDARFSQGWLRRIDLREGLRLEIDQSQAIDRLLMNCSDGEDSRIYCSFLLSGNVQWILNAKPHKTLLNYATGQYSLVSNGLYRRKTDAYEIQPWFSVAIEIHSKILCSFAKSSEGELPKHLQHLVKPLSQEIYMRSADIQPMMGTVLQQILHCPYVGIIKRAYLESKAIEIIALVLEHEAAIRQGEIKKGVLKPDQLERVHYAKEILLRDLSNPPTLTELTQQVGLNAFTLEQQFRQVFGNTVFGHLQTHRLEAAKQLLAEQDISVAGVARRVGYASTTSFTKAFKHRFGVTPKGHQKRCRT
ncbi:MAG: AraC family transcriptional regulator [Cyanobacteria bacterium P01_F01_bin.86]